MNSCAPQSTLGYSDNIFEPCTASVQDVTYKTGTRFGVPNLFPMVLLASLASVTTPCAGPLRLLKNAQPTRTGFKRKDRMYSRRHNRPRMAANAQNPGTCGRATGACCSDPDPGDILQADVSGGTYSIYCSSVWLTMGVSHRVFGVLPRRARSIHCNRQKNCKTTETTLSYTPKQSYAIPDGGN